jgi:hypothetical protein
VPFLFMRDVVDAAKNVRAMFSDKIKAEWEGAASEPCRVSNIQ